MAATRPSVALPAATLLATVALPLAGAIAGGRDLRPILRFPPRLEMLTDYTRFSWLAFAAIAALLAAIAISWLTASRTGQLEAARPTGAAPAIARASNFPPWGWLAITWTGAWWVLAWNRFSWFAGWQLYTFFPLWLGFIIGVNAATEWRSGTCLLRRAPGRWLGLFAASAGFWWLFEWLNRFVRNWHYLAVDQFGPVSYAAHATLCFSTVLPAVAAVREYLGTVATFERRARSGPAWIWMARPSTGWLLVAGALAALLLTGARPMVTYPALWMAPLALAWGLAILARLGGVSAMIARGNWRTAAAWMVAALVCGFFWELWNWQSLAKWIYTVPYVDRWHVFEMPLLGYVGYLPFGLECLLVVERIIADEDLSACAET